MSDWASLKSVYNSAFLCNLGFFMVSFLITVVAYNSMGASATQVAIVFSVLTFEAVMCFSRFSAPVVGGLLWDFVNPVAPFLLVGAVGLFLIPIYAFGVHNYQKAIGAEHQYQTE